MSLVSNKSNPPKKPVDAYVIAADLLCDVCDAESEEAILDRRSKVLTWTCPNGHRNLLEDWSI